jgi:hypothetical protein
MRIVPYKPEHLQRMSLQEAQAYLSAWVTPDMAKALGDGLVACSALEGDDVLGCAGIIPIWAGRAVAWAYLAPDIGTRFVQIHRAVKKVIEGCYVQRLEATADADFPAANRWLRMLGFQLETPEPMRAYTPAGTDCFLYARVR